MKARLRLVPAADPAEQSADSALAAIVTRILHERGFAELQRAIARHTEGLAKANRSALAAEGYIA